MNIGRTLGLVALTLAAATLAVAQPASDFTLARGKAGALLLGATPDDVIALFGRDNVTRVDLHLEGSPTPALEIRIQGGPVGHPSLVAELFPPNPDHVWRVNIYDQRFRTIDGLGIGSTFAEVQGRHDTRIGNGEGATYAAVRELNMSFNFGDFLITRTIPAAARVQSVLIFIPSNELLRNDR